MLAADVWSEDLVSAVLDPLIMYLGKLRLTYRLVNPLNELSLQGLVIAGLADYGRPAEKLSITQSTALTATGSYSFHIHW